MMKASVKGSNDGDATGLAATFTLNGGDMKLRATMTDTASVNGPSFNCRSLALEKPGSFVIDYTPSNKDVKFQFMNAATIMDKPLNLTYTHWRGPNRTALDGALVIDPSNRVSLSYALDSGNCKLKYNYLHKGCTAFEPTYDFAKNSWDFSVSQRLYGGGDVVRASYQSSSKVLGLEWCKNTSLNGSFKVSASMNLADSSKIPKLSGESTLSFEM